MTTTHEKRKQQQKKKNPGTHVQLFLGKSKKSHLFPDGFFLSIVINTMGFEPDFDFD